MKTYQKLNRFPLGAIRAQGFLKDQMLRGKDGMAGHLYELEPEMIAAPYIRDFNVPAWTKTEGTGWGAEIAGNYWTGYIQYAFTLNDPEMIAIATDWVNGVLKNKQSNGYLGTYWEDSEYANKYEDYNAWGTACGMRGLLAFYEATGRRDVLDAVYDCMLWFCRTWTGDRKTTYAGPFIMEIMVFTYYYTGDQRLIDFCEAYMDYLCRNDLFQNSYKSMLNEPVHYNSNHAGAFGSISRLPALVYTVTGKQEYLDAATARIRKVREKLTHLAGGPSSASEFYAPISCVSETEYCAYTYANSAYSYMSYITGEAKYGDYMEQIFYNGAQGARKKDEKAIAYMTAPNQVYATMTSSNGSRDDQVYAPCFPVACCPVNAVAIVPEFIRGLFLHDDQDNLYATAYGPCSLEYPGFRLREETMYPFRNSVRFLLDCDKEFTLNLHIPTWSEGYTITVNGSPVSAAETPEGYAAVAKHWACGDVVEITFRASVKVVTVNDADAGGKFPLAVKYGALLFSYHVPEVWEPTPGRPMTPLPEGWDWYNVNPYFEQPDVPDIHDRNGMLKHAFTWNVAVDENWSEADFTIEQSEPAGYVWENPPIKLHTHCYKAPYMWSPYQPKTFEPFGKYQYVTHQLPLTLEPYGCTNLRITYFAKADPECVNAVLQNKENN